MFSFFFQQKNIYYMPHPMEEGYCFIVCSSGFLPSICVYFILVNNFAIYFDFEIYWHLYIYKCVEQVEDVVMQPALKKKSAGEGGIGHLLVAFSCCQSILVIIDTKFTYHYILLLRIKRPSLLRLSMFYKSFLFMDSLFFG